MSSLGFDADVDGAWRHHQIELGDRLAALNRDDILTLRAADDRRPLMTFVVTGSRRVRARIAVADLPADRPRSDTVAMLRAIGWRQLRGPVGDIIVEDGRARVDRLAHAAVGALQQVWDIVHPSFLAGSEEVSGEPEPPDRRHLLDRVFEALRGRPEVPAERVPGSSAITLRTPPVHSWIHALPNGTAIEFRAFLTGPVADRAAAARYIADNPRRWSAITVGLFADRVVATLRAECTVLEPANLHASLDIWLKFLQRPAADLADVCAARPRQPTTTASGMPDALDGVLTLLDDNTRTDPVTVAAMCGYSRETVRECLAYCAREGNRAQQRETAHRGADESAADRAAADWTRWRFAIRSLGTALRALDDAARRRSTKADPTKQ
ncbi:MAG: hypothetical protein SW127_01800 [Actinomycetota bacterium]|nr:hypothetical protein [Actinomycetota bacterium]